MFVCVGARSLLTTPTLLCPPLIFLFKWKQCQIYRVYMLTYTTGRFSKVSLTIIVYSKLINELTFENLCQVNFIVVIVYIKLISELTIENVYFEVSFTVIVYSKSISELTFDNLYQISPTRVSALWLVHTYIHTQ